MPNYLNRTLAALVGVLSLIPYAGAQTVKPVAEDEDIVAQSFEVPAETLKATPPAKSSEVPLPQVSNTAPGVSAPLIPPSVARAPVGAQAVKTETPASPKQVQASGTEDIGTKAGQSAAALPASHSILPHDSSALPLPAAKSFAKAAPTYKWTNAPLSQAVDEIARANGLTVQVILPEGLNPTVTGDFSSMPPKDVLRAITLKCRLALSMRNGAYTITVPQATPVSSPAPVLNTREFTVPQDESANFNKAFAKTKESGRLTLLGNDQAGNLMVRVADTPDALDNLTKEFAASKIRAVNAMAVKPSVIDAKIEVERKKLIEKRERLLNRYVAESR